ncbi:uncharacterized protein DDB_G0290685-like [Hyposmocoma kahamanoa]|uniref:uncharacterized protein DDB_G0290685-like n=1 Tax=Hyposmocoma kahamanoa TaxID=1477025 RepID=UPI000E6D8E25|nr:uncharacterized protein DDB_G0290685-like [Hyposmocoma kahamanoa]
MTLNGLETAYCAQVGGPYRSPSIKIVDEIRFQELQVRGKKYIENSTHKEMQEVTIEFLDVAVSIKIYMDGAGVEEGEGKGEGKEGEEDGGRVREEGGEEGEDEYEDGNRRSQSKLRAKSNYYLEFVGWRSLEYYAVAGPENPLYRLIVGYAVDEIPRAIVDYLYRVLDQAIAKVDSSDSYAATTEQEEGAVRAGVPEHNIDKGHDDDVHYEDDYDSSERLACKKNKHNCKKIKKILRKKNKNRLRAHRRQHRYAVYFPVESSDNNPSDGGDSIQERNVLGDRDQSGDVGGGSIDNERGLDGIGNGGDTFIDGNVDNQNAEDGGTSFNDGNENNGPGIYTDDNVNNYKPSGGTGIYSTGNRNYDVNNIFSEGNVNYSNSNKRDDMYIGESDISGGGSVNNMGYENLNLQNNYSNNNRKSNILPNEKIKS